MTGFRKSPLNKDGLVEMPIEPTAKNVIDFSILTQKITLANKMVASIDFTAWLDESSDDSRKSYVYKIAKAFKYKSEFGKRPDSLSNDYRAFTQYLRFFDAQKINPFSKSGFIAYCGRGGEIHRQMALKNKPLPFAYMYENGAEIGYAASTAPTLIIGIKRCLIDAEVFDTQWERDVPKISTDLNPTRPYSQKTLGTILRRLQFLFYSISTQLISSKKKGEQLDTVSAVVDELDDGSLWTLELKNAPPKIGDVNHYSPFNMAMNVGYYCFSHYSSFNMTSIINVCHPIEQSSDKTLDRTTRYTKIRASKFRANKVVQAEFLSESESESEDFINLEIDKRDGLTFIGTFSQLSSLYIPEHDKKNKPLFYHLDSKGQPVRLSLIDKAKVTQSILSVYHDDRAVHSGYLVERFDEVLEQNAITEVFIRKNVVVKQQRKLTPKGIKRWSIAMAYAALRSMTDVTLKGIFMPLSYSNVNERGFITVSYFYDNGKSGFFEVDGRYEPFLKRLEAYSSHYNPVVRSKNKPNQKITPFLFPLGQKYQTYQWDGVELDISGYLRRVGIFSGDYLVSLSSQQFRATAANNNFNPDDGGVSVATSLTQNTLQTLRDHYINGHPTQNQVIASQAIEVLEVYCATGNLEDAKEKVRRSRRIEVLEYDAWKQLRQPTNMSGFLCGGTPSGRAETEHRASQRLATNLFDGDVKIPCYQYDHCIECSSARLVNDVQSAYKLLSFVELLEESSLSMPERQDELNERANKLLLLAENNLSENVLDAAEQKLHDEGRYFIHSTNFMNSMETVVYAKN